MPAPNRIYFPQIAAGGWRDWVEVVNVGPKEAKVTAIARDQNGKAVWSAEKSLIPFQCWVVPAEGVADRRGDVSLQVMSDQPILGERHCHSGTQVLDFPGAAPELGTAGKRLFFSEVASYIGDFIRFLNLGEADAIVNVIAHDRNTGRVVGQFSGRIRPSGFWTLSDAQIRSVTGTLEVVSTQPIVGERHSHYQGGKSAVGQYGQVIDGSLGEPKRIFFGQIAPGQWYDWVILTNVGPKEAKVTVIARDQNGKTVWSQDRTLRPFQCWVPPVDQAVKNIDVSLEVRSDQYIVGERHQHGGTQVLSFPGAALELGSVGKRLFFPEVYSGAYDWFRFLNVGEADAIITFVARDRNTAQIRHQFSGRARPMGFWTVPDDRLKDVTGTVEVVSTQPIVGERHMHYQGWKTAISQYGQVIEV